ncbi:hypothetical protein [Hymenobacter persicinus]|uniref:Uncharacterized protein n=1 Tax=Hymenobacter persicinus TaxID=2025506 RepID=A0A4Q5L821_9BACT|nr:hypothetical protein [Hymenobacter persicinus]RYU77778.1 hypothetical protein EWM57_16755 [Hymenobacter persicinus]
MKHFLPLTALTLLLSATAFGQAKKAAPAAKAPATAAAKPTYAGFYMNGKLVSEIDCYGVDEVSIIYPYFPVLDKADQLRISVVAGSYDQNGKFVLEYRDNKTLYEGVGLEALRDKYAERGYGIVTKSNLLQDYNEQRATRFDSDYIVDVDNPSFNVLKYTNLDPATHKGSVVYYEIGMWKIKGYETKYDEYSKSVKDMPIYESAVVYTSPKIKLNNRVLESTVAEKMAPAAVAKAVVAKKSKMVALRALGAATGLPTGDGNVADETRPAEVLAKLPEMQNENCTPKGRALSLDDVTAVGRNGFGESVTIR